MNTTAPSFPADERQWLLSLPRIGPTVVDRLEQAGYGSIAHLRAAGPDAVVAAVCCQVGSTAWGNRRRALARALAGLGGVGAAGGASGAGALGGMAGAPR